MRIALIMVMSLNGKISRTHDSKVDWNSAEDLEWFKKITKFLGVVVVGRKTFETFKAPLKDRVNIVMTRTPSAYTSDKNLIYTSNSPEQIVEMVEKMGHDSLAVIGGQKVFTAFLNARLIDEVYITYEPLFIDGIDPFDTLGFDLRMRMVDLNFINSNSFVVHYIIDEFKNGIL
jgi:dihydrofolate reductase